METLQTRLELQSMVQQWINGTMQQYNISPSMMDDALSKALLSIKEQVIKEFLIANPDFTSENNLLYEGQIVNKDTLIARMGTTGSSTGTHLHFEVRMDNTPFNPWTLY